MMKSSSLWLATCCLLLGETLALPSKVFQQQTAFRLPEPAGRDDESMSKGQYSRVEQNGSVCETYGERQWTGTVDVRHDRRLFYWFFESRDNPSTDPAIVWMNGGPGGSSMLGLFTENGPCVLPKESRNTRPNPHSWNSHASVIYLDQPAGTGLSRRKAGSPIPNSDEDGAADFETFLKIFFESIFPEKANLPIHIAGESYGGHFVPSYVDRILTSRLHDSKNAFRGELASMIIVNGMIDLPDYAIGAYELLCADDSSAPMNESSCAEWTGYVSECQKLQNYCEMSSDVEICRTATMYCMDNMFGIYYREVISGARNPYNIHKPCHEVPFCWDPNLGNQTTYLNTPWVQAALDLPRGFTFQEVALDVNTAFALSGSMFLSMKPVIANILDNGHKIYSTGIPLLVINGNDDFIVNTPGQKRAYETISWNGQADFNIQRWKPLFGETSNVGDGQPKESRKGEWKQTTCRRLVFVSVDDAGHTAPGDQPKVVLDVVDQWLNGWEG